MFVRMFNTASGQVAAQSSSTISSLLCISLHTNFDVVTARPIAEGGRRELVNRRFLWQWHPLCFRILFPCFGKSTCIRTGHAEAPACLWWRMYLMVDSGDNNSAVSLMRTFAPHTLSLSLPVTELWFVLPYSPFILLILPDEVHCVCWTLLGTPYTLSWCLHLTVLTNEAFCFSSVINNLCQMPHTWHNTLSAYHVLSIERGIGGSNLTQLRTSLVFTDSDV